MKVLTLFLLGVFFALSVPASQIIYVKPAAFGPTYNGTSWNNAYGELRDALSSPAVAAASAGNPVELWVAAGTYKPTDTGIRGRSFAVPSYVTIRGGFAGTETNPNQRPANGVWTVLSGDINTADPSGITTTNIGGILAGTLEAPPLLDLTTVENTMGNNCYNVITCEGSHDVVLDGLIITGGNADNKDPYQADIFTGANLSDMTALDFGSDDHPNLTGSPLVLPNPVVGGGGIFVSNNLARPANQTTLTLVNCVFIHNAGYNFGGGITAYGANLNLAGCRFLNNYTTGRGGAFMGINQFANFSRCSFSNNVAGIQGGAVCLISFPSTNTTPQLSSAQQLAAIDAVGSGIKLFASVGMFLLTKHNNTGIGDVYKLMAGDPEMDSILSYSEISGNTFAEIGPGDAYSFVGIAVASGQLAADLAIRFGGDPNNPAYKNWVKFNTFFNQYLTPLGILQLFSQATGGQLGNLTHQPSAEDQAAAYAANQQGNYNGATYTKLRGCYFTGNTSGEGGALVASYDNVQCDGCWFNRNTASVYGGAAEFNGWNTPRLFNCAFSSNYCNAGSSAVEAANHSRLQVLNSTFVNNNSGTTNGFCLAVELGSAAKVFNSVLWGNLNATHPAGGADFFVPRYEDLSADLQSKYDSAGPAYIDLVGTLDLRASTVQSFNSLPHGTEDYQLYPWNANSFLTNISKQYFAQADSHGFADLAGYPNLGEGIRPNSFTLIQGANEWGNSATDPKLRGLNGVVPTRAVTLQSEGSLDLWAYNSAFVPLPTFQAGDQLLANGQAGFFSGPNTFAAAYNNNLADIFGAPEDPAAMDRGCVQFQGYYQQGLQDCVFYVVAGAAPNGDGLSWATALPGLAPFMHGQLPSGVQVWFAGGTYAESTSDGQLPPNLRIYGGFAGTETNLTQRNWTSHPVFYTGNLVCYGAVTLDGLTVTNYHSANYPAISAGNGQPAVIANCTFVNNSGGYGGAVFWAGPVTASNSTFSANSSPSPGGAISAQEVTALNCWFIKNNSSHAGGAISFNDYGEAINCVFVGNNASQGSAIIGEGGPGTWHLFNDTFYGNGPTAVQIFGSYNTLYPLLGVTGPAPTPVNCLFWGNVSDGVLAQSFPGSSADPLFLNPPALNFQLSANSPAVGAGTNLNLPADFPANDLAGNPRLTGGRLDLGAFQFQGTAGQPAPFTTTIALNGANQIFTVALGTNATPSALQWQVNTGNGVWVNVTNGAVYQGVNTLQLTVISPGLAMFGYQYRLNASGGMFPLAAVGLVSSTPGGIVYVRQGATGSNNGSSWQNAYTDIASVLGGAANDWPIQVWVAKGSYTGSGQLNSGMQLLGGFAGTETDLSQRNWNNNPTLFTGSMQCRGSVVLDGFVVTNFHSADYPAIYNAQQSSWATINNCTFINNSSTVGGGAIYWEGAVVVANSKFINNTNPQGGGAIFGWEVTAVNCWFEKNISAFKGGAIFFNDYGEAINCVFTGNNAPQGSAIFGNTGGPELWHLFNDTFYSNGPATIVISGSYSPSSPQSGFYGPVPAPVNCLFANNVSDGVTAQTFSGYSSDPFFINPSSGNFQLSAYSPAIGLGLTNGLPADFPTNDLAGNPRFVNGRLDLGAYQFQGSPLNPPAFTVQPSPEYFINGLYGPYYNFMVALGTNAAPTGLQWQVNPGNGVWTNVTNGSLYQGATSLQLILNNPGPTLNGYQYRLTGTAANGAFFQLAPAQLALQNLASSFAPTGSVDGALQSGQWGPTYTISVNLGTNAAGASLQWQVNPGTGTWTNLINGTLYQGVTSQTLMIINPTPAMNGYQYRLTGALGGQTFTLAPLPIAANFPRIIYVDGTRGYPYYTNYLALNHVAPAYDGLSWNTAYPTLHEALALAQPGAEIWVRSGTYYPLRTLGVDGYALPSALALSKGVRVLGGFAGTETSDTQRDWQAHVTVISGTASAPADGVTGYTYAASPNIFVNSAAITISSVLDGFTLTAASNGAILNLGASPLIQNCLIVSNAAPSGGAIGNWSNASPTLINCIVTANLAQQGALYFENSSGLLENCVIANNNALFNGGAIFNTNSTLTLLNSSLLFNGAAGTSGGLFAGGGTNNIVNSILWGNSGLQLDGSAASAISYSCVQNGSTTNHNLISDPIFALAASNNFQLSAVSPLINGGNVAAITGLNFDLAGNARTTGGLVDIGPYQHQVTPVTALTFGSLPYSIIATNQGVYSFVVSGAPAPFTNIQWQVNTGAGFGPVTNVANLNYSTTATTNSAALALYLANSSAGLGLDGAQYRFIAPGLNFTSPPAVLFRRLPVVLFVNAAATGPTYDGLTWATAYTNPAQAFAATYANIGEIWVVKGTYPLPSAVTLNHPIYGGFLGNESLLTQRNWSNNPTIFIPAGNNVISTLDGLIIQGSASLTNGLVINFASPLIQNCLFTGGINQVLVNIGQPTFANCVFSNAAAGLSVIAGAPNAFNCRFTGGLTQGVAVNLQGGAVISNSVFFGVMTGVFVTNNASCSVWRSIFQGNTGAGVLLDGLAGSMTIRDSLFVSNNCDSVIHHGAVRSTMAIINCTFANNQQPDGAITAPNQNDQNGLTVRNCILWNNHSTGPVGTAFGNGDINEIYTYNGYEADSFLAASLPSIAQEFLAHVNPGLVANSCLQGLSLFSGANNFGADPRFVNPAAGNFLPGTFSYAQDSGDSSQTVPGELDLAGNPRVAGPAVDLGAYEVQTPSLGVIAVQSGPQSLTVNPPGSAVFTATLTPNSYATNFVWQINTGSGWNNVTVNSIFTISNQPNATTLRIAPVDLTMNGLQVRLSAIPLASVTDPATLTVQARPLVGSVRQSASTIAILPIGVNASTYVWQFYNGSSWVTISNGSIYSITYATNTSTLTLLSLVPALNGQYRFASADGVYTSLPITATAFVPPVLYVMPGASGAGTGTNWANAFTKLGDALAASFAGEQIWVASGNYFATNNSGAAPWEMPKNIAIYGGFTGSETNFAQRNWAANPSVLWPGTNAPIFSNQVLQANAAAILDGFTLTGGNGQSAIVNIAVNPTINNCIFSNNVASAVSNSSSSVMFSNCCFVNNCTLNGGGAIMSVGGTNNIYACQFLTNTATGNGGAVLALTNRINITSSTFAGNRSSAAGGAIALSGTTSYLVLAQSSLMGNTASNGGALFGDTTINQGNVRSCLIAQNTATNQGGGIAWAQNLYLSLQVEGCTITANSAGGNGGGMWTWQDPIVINSILWGNTGLGALEYQQIYNADFVADLAAYAHIQGPIPYALQWYNCFIQGLNFYNQTLPQRAFGLTVTYAQNNTSQDPAFVNAAAGNYQLQPSSPAVNAGSNYWVSAAADVLGHPRIYGPAVDIGAYELQTNQAPPFQSATLPVSFSGCDGAIGTISVSAAGSTNIANIVWQINTGSGFHDLTSSGIYAIKTNANSSVLTINPVSLALDGYQFRVRVVGYAYTSPPATLSVSSLTVAYVNPAATGNGSGTNWTNAFTNLQTAINSGSCLQLWVAQGNYIIPTVSNVSTSFRLAPFLDLRGGFIGTETNLNQRDYIHHPTILLATNGQSIFFNDGTAAAIDQSSVLDGFVLKGATLSPAIFNIDASPIIRNCVFTNNAARAIENFGLITGANSTVTNCQFINNTGGGILNLASAPLIANCSFTGNSATGFGAAIDNEQGSPVIANCVFTQNAANLGAAFYNNTTNTGTVVLRGNFRNNAGSQGGAIYNTSGSSLMVQDSLFTQNTASITGGAIFDSGALTLLNCTLANNSANYVAGGIWVNGAGALSVANSIIWDNNVNASGVNLLLTQINGSQPATLLNSVANSIVQGLTAPANNNLLFNALFANEINGDYHLTAASPAVNAGNPGFNTPGELDLEGNNRLAGSSVDLGAYEFQGTPTAAVNLSLVPQSITTCASNNIVFTVAAPADSGYTFTWQQSNGSSFINLASNAVCQISMTNGISTLTLPNVDAGLNGSNYRVLISGNSTTATTAIFTLTVNPRSVIYVNAHAVPGGNGSSWNQAFVNLADAFGQGGCDDIWIAAGTYIPTNDTTGQPVTLQLQPDLRVFGGFAGTETNFAQRNPSVNRVIISGLNGTTPLQGNGAVATIDNSTVLDGLTITGNSNNVAFLLSGASPLIQNCIFTNNSAGAVLSQAGAAPSFVNCIFSGNVGLPAILSQGASPSFAGCLFVNNQALNGQSGGAIAASANSTVSIGQCVFSNNTAVAEGGGLYLNQSSVSAQNSLFVFNAANHGGAISGTNATLVLLNDTVAYNSAAGVGGVTIAGQGDVTNSIFWGNGTDEISQISGDVSLAYSCVENLNAFAGDNNTSSDPQFVNSSAGLFALQTNSPCVDIGDTAAVASSFDLAGQSRIQGFSVDLGAYESANLGGYIQITQQPKSQTGCVGGSVSFTTAGPAGFGSNFVWQVNSSSGFTNLPVNAAYSVVTNVASSTLTISGLDLSFNGLQFRAEIGSLNFYTAVANLIVLTPEIRYVNGAATGNGSGSSWANAFTNLDAALAVADACDQVWVAQGVYISTNHVGGAGFVMANPTTLYGGFVGNETNGSQRDGANHPTVLASAGQTNVIQVLADGTLDGFTITAGNSATSGLYIQQASPVVHQCNFASNACTALVNTGNGSPTIVNCVFNANRSSGSGGAILNQGASLTVLTSAFTGNGAGQGGAVCNLSNCPSVLFDHCLFTSNQATSEGGAVYNGSGCNVAFVNCLVYGNTAKFGGAVANYGQLGMASCTLSLNIAKLAGGAGYSPQGLGQVTNSIFWGDRPSELSGSFATAVCLVQGGTPDGAMNYDPQFENPSGGDFRLQFISPAIGAGWADAAAGIATDLDQNPRFQDWGLDLGAYQENSGPYDTTYVTAEPLPQVMCASDDTVQFTFTSQNAYNYTWQFYLGNGAWEPLNDGSPGAAGEYYSINYSGDTSILTVHNVTSALNGLLFQVADFNGFASPPVALTVIQPGPIYVNAAAASGGNGSSWAGAFSDLNSAFTAVNACQSTIWVAAGTYSTLSNGPISIPSFASGIKIYGGFVGTESDLSQRNPSVHPSILAGTGSANLPVVILDGTYGVIDTNTVLDGFTIQRGGTGISLTAASPTIANCIIVSNLNGGVTMVDGSPVFQHDQFLANAALNGGAMNLRGHTQSCTPLIQACVFRGNRATNGAAIYARNANPTLADSLISGNAGTALIFSNSTALLINDTVTANSAGLIANGAWSEIINSIFWGNGSTATNLEAAQIFGALSVSNSCVQGLNLYSGHGNIGTDPLFGNSVPATNAPTLVGDFHLYGFSPAIAAGNPDVAASLAFDLDGNPRLDGSGKIDLGAYEFQGVPGTFTIMQSPTNTQVLFDQSATLTVAVSGLTPPFQWFFNGMLIPNATNATLTIPSATCAAAGAYQVLIANLFAPPSALLTVLDTNLPVFITDLPAVTNAPAGAAITLSVSVAANCNSPGYQWIRNNVILTGQTNSTVSVSTNASYAVVVSNPNGSVVSQAETVVFHPLISSSTIQAGVGFHLHIQVAQNTPVTVLTSTNLINWSNLGTAVMTQPGVCDFTDTNSLNLPYRFYQLIQ